MHFFVFRRVQQKTTFFGGVHYGGRYFKILGNYTETGLNLFVFNKNLYMQNISEKNQSLQVAHQQRKFEIIHNMLQYMQLYIARKTRPYQNGSNRSHGCLEEKIAILRANPVNIINQRTEIVSKC